MSKEEELVDVFENTKDMVSSLADTMSSFFRDLDLRRKKSQEPSEEDVLEEQKIKGIVDAFSEKYKASLPSDLSLLGSNSLPVTVVCLLSVLQRELKVNELIHLLASIGVLKQSRGHKSSIIEAIISEKEILSIKKSKGIVILRNNNVASLINKSPTFGEYCHWISESLIHCFISDYPRIINILPLNDVVNLMIDRNKQEELNKTLVEFPLWYDFLEENPFWKASKIISEITRAEIPLTASAIQWETFSVGLMIQNLGYGVATDIFFLCGLGMIPRFSLRGRNQMVLFNLMTRTITYVFGRWMARFQLSWGANSLRIIPAN